MGGISCIINLAWFYSLQWTTATNVAILIRTDIVFVILIGVAFGAERIRPGQFAIVPLMMIGLAAIILVDRFSRPKEPLVTYGKEAE